MPTPLLVAAIAWLAFATLLWAVILLALRHGPGGTPLNGLLWWVVKLYVAVMHRPTYVGAELLPVSDADHHGLIVVANHTGAVDPLLIQRRCPFLIRWLMASEMMGPSLDWLWKDEYVIPVDRDGRDTAPLREAIRHVRAGGAVGIFPEGRITMPPREVRPFLPGVGMIVARTGAPVLLVWVSGTPETNLMGEALATRSRARVEFIDLIDFDGDRDPVRITSALRQRLAEVSGWPLNDEILPPGGTNGAEQRAA